MNESEFLDVTDRIFSRIEDAIDDAGLDADFVTNGNVLEIEFDDGGKIVVNRHAANQELWIAAKSGGYHFACKDGQWLATRDGAEFYSTLKTAIAEACGQPDLELDI